MSLLDDVSIVVTPNGYKAGELYAVIPVPTEGAELVTDVDFLLTGTQAENTTGTYWITGTGWTISGGVLIGTAGASSFCSSVGLNSVINKRYVAVITASVSSGQAFIYIGSYGQYETLSNGTNTYYLTASNVNLISIYKTATCNCTIDNVSVKEYTSADMDVTRATAATRVDENGLIEDVLANVPRIDYTGGGCPHILAEPQRTNEITYSEDFSDSSWTKSGTTITPNNATSPDGTLNASTINFSAPSQYLLYNETMTTVIGEAVSISIYADTNTSDFLSFGGATPSGTDVSNVETLSGGFYRHTVTRTFTVAATTTVQFIIWDAAIGNYVIWGAQFELGSYATSYIPNFGTALGVTRNQDIFTRDGIGSLINSTEGVLFVEIAALANDGTFRNISLSNGTTGQAVRIYFRNQDNKITVLIGSSSGASVTIDVTDALSFNKIAVQYKVNDVRVFVNGSLEGTITSVAMPVGLNKLALDVANNLPFYGKVKQLQVYDTSLSDTQLAALTS